MPSDRLKNAPSAGAATRCSGRDGTATNTRRMKQAARTVEHLMNLGWEPQNWQIRKLTEIILRGESDDRRIKDDPQDGEGG